MGLNWIQEAVNSRLRICYERSANPKSPSTGLKTLQDFTLTLELGFWALKRARTPAAALILRPLSD